jgi:U3 small nucleolar RNA-associated protein 21
MPSSALFVPYKATGLVCDGQQLWLQSLGTANFLTAPQGRAFQVYNLERLSVAMVSKQLARDIT